LLPQFFESRRETAAAAYTLSRMLPVLCNRGVRPCLTPPHLRNYPDALEQGKADRSAAAAAAKTRLVHQDPITRLMIEARTRDLAMFNLAIDSKLRGCDAARATGR